MQKTFLRRMVVLFLIALSGLMFSGCGKGSGLDGKTYHEVGGGPITIEFKDGKAKVDVGGDAKTLDYKVEGDKVTIVNKEQGDLVLDKHPDGSLTSPLGEFVAK